MAQERRQRWNGKVLGENEGENKEAVGLAKRMHEEDHQEIGLEEGRVHVNEQL